MSKADEFELHLVDISAGKKPRASKHKRSLLQKKVHRVCEGVKVTVRWIIGCGWSADIDGCPTFAQPGQAFDWAEGVIFAGKVIGGFHESNRT